jgi:hypothetical protein
VKGAAEASPLHEKYGTRTDANSAREMLAERLAQPAPAKADAAAAPQAPKAEHKEAAAAASGGAAAVGKFLKSREGKKLENQVVRGVFGLLKKRL